MDAPGSDGRWASAHLRDVPRSFSHFLLMSFPFHMNLFFKLIAKLLIFSRACKIFEEHSYTLLLKQHFTNMGAKGDRENVSD
jgi:hypothetical protein